MTKQYQQLIQKATSHLSAEQGDKVVATCKKTLKRYPRDFDALHLMGVGYKLTGKNKRALDCYRQALKVRPEGTAVLYCNLVRAMLDEPGQNIFRAREFAEQARALAPDLVETWEISSDVALRIGDVRAAESMVLEALDRSANDVKLLLKLSSVYRSTDRYEEAAAVLEKAQRLADTSPDVMFEIGIVNDLLGKTEEALEAFERARQLGYDNLKVDRSIVALLRIHGKIDQLAELATKTMDESSASAGPCLALMHAGRFPGGAEAARRYLESIGAKKNPTYFFALADAFDKEGNFDQAFGLYAIANKRKQAKERPFRIDSLRENYSNVRSIFESTDDCPVPQFEADSDYPTPVFVLGMPRSGTSLTEQLLGCHSQVFAAGELPTLGKLVNFGMEGFQGNRRQQQPEYWQWVRTTYLRHIGDVSSHASVVVDKMPFNFQHVGFITRLFPNAVIVHTQRDPIDTCLSIYKANFVSHLPYAQDLAALGEYYVEYCKLMSFWHQHFPGAILDSHYEDLVSNLRPSVERMLARCGLEWEDGIERFHESDRIVRTASNDQVRQPIYRSSIEKWRAYEHHLGPLIEVLEKHKDDLPADLWPPSAGKEAEQSLGETSSSS